jgi:hypothetical protein
MRDGGRMDFALLHTLDVVPRENQDRSAAELWAIYQMAQGSAVGPDDFANLTPRQREGWRDVLNYAAGMARKGAFR